MDGYKRPFRGSKIYVHKKDDEDKTLVNLYKESEYAKEDTPKKSRKNEDADTSDEDIDDFINTSNNTDEEDIPVKKSISYLATHVILQMQTIKKNCIRICWRT